MADHGKPNAEIKRQMEEQIRCLKEELEARVEERTRQLAEANEEMECRILERKIAEQKMRKATNMLNSILDSATDYAIVAIDLDYRILHYNRASERIFHRSAADTVGKTIREIQPWEMIDPGRLEDAVDTIFKEGKFEYEFSMNRTDNAQRFMHCVITPMEDENGDWIGYVFICSDVTQRKVVEQTLRQAKESAEAASRLKSQFLANVSHEIRTPLNCIVGFSEAIVSTSRLLEAHEHASVILHESESLLLLINDLLDHAKIEAGRMDLEKNPFDLRLLLGRIAISARLQCQQKELSFGLKVGQNVPQYVVGDSLRLRQILTNLIGNAIKFTQEGSINVTAEKDEEASSGEQGFCRIRFAVADTGIGIPEDKQQAIFESFIQADGATTRKYGGTGLGVTIASRLVELMGGKIDLESEVGRGSTFRFSLRFPLCKEPPQSLPVEPDLDLRPVPVPKCERKTGKILVAEDYLPNQQVVRLHLDSARHEVTVVSNGEEAVEKCRQENFDLILMDLQMPVKDGLEAAGEIRRLDERFAGTPILAMTASADAPTRNACREAGMNDVMTKPVRREPLLAAVSRWVDLGGASAVVPSSGEDSGEDTSNAPIHIEQGVEEFAGNRILFETVLAQFVEQAEDQLETLRMAAESGDAETLRKEAHKLRGGAANLTAMRLSNSAAKLEDSAGTGEIAEAVAMIAAIESEFQQLKEYLDN